MITYTFDLDVIPGSVPVVVPLKQYCDDTLLVFNVYSRLGNLELKPGTTVAIRGTKSDGNGISVDVSLSGNTVSVPVTKQMVAAAGKALYELVFVKDGKEFITASFVMFVQRAALDKDTLQSGSVIKELVDVIDRTDEIIAAANKADEARRDIAAAQSNVAEMNENVNTKSAEVDKKAKQVAAIKTEADTIAKQALEKASNAENEVAENQNKLQNLSDADNAMRLLLEGKVDDAYVDQGYLYLTSNGVVVAGPLGPFSGSGGGSGGSGGNNASLSVTNTSGWLSKSIANGSPCEIKVVWSSVEDGLPTGNGVMRITVNGTVKAVLDVAQGEVTVDVAKYLNVGSNVVKVTIADVYDNNRTINYSIMSISLSISSSFDSSVPYTGAILFPFVPVGNVMKTVHFELDGREIGTLQTSVSGRQQSFTITQQSHGAHKFKCYFDCEINGETVRSNVLYYEIICLEELNDQRIIASDFDATEIKQYTTVYVNWMVYDPLEMTVPVSLMVNGNVVSNQTVDRTRQTWAYRADHVGELVLKIVSGDVSKTFVLNVSESDINVEAETEALALYLSSYGRSNNEENPGTWEYNGIASEFVNFNFTSDGWQADDNGITVLRVTGDARLVIPYKIFQNDFRSTGKTIELKFATRDVRNYDAEIISCYANGRGLKVTAQQVTMASEQSKVSYQFKDDELVRVTFVVEKRSEHRLVYLYINGICSQVIQYPTNDDFAQPEPVNISIGSNECTVDLYCIRVYDNDMTRMQVLNNWIADTNDVTTMLDRFTRNNVYDAYGKIVADNLPKSLPYMVLECPELPQYKGDKKTVSGRYIDPSNNARSFSFVGANIDVQGTSSAGYERKNYKIKFKNGFTMSASGATLEAYKMRENSIATNVFTFKADVASSEGCNNVELVRLYNEACPYKTPPQKANASVRQGIDGFPIVIFWSDGNSETFLGKYNFNNDKGTPEVYGFSEGDESWETLNNTSERTLFKSADFTGDGWKNDFEARYPDGNVDVTKLSAFATWVVSTIGNLDKFRNELEQHAVKDSALFYYLFTELFLMVDSRAKNAFPTEYAGDAKVCWLPYDMDTALGINNEGALTFGYSLEDTDHLESGADVYNGQNSTFWCNLRDAFGPELKAMYQKLRSDGVLSYEKVESMFEEHQSKWPEAVFNDDAWFKYIDPLTEKGNASYLPMLQGSKAEQRKWWLYHRFRYLDSKYNAGDSLNDFITLRGYAKADITVVPYADIYPSVKYGSYLVQTRGSKGNTYVLACPLDNVSDTEIYIYDASLLASVGDLSGLKVGFADFSKAVKLLTIKLGDASAAYSNGNLTELYLGNNRLLQTVDVRNCVALAQAVDLSGCVNIEHIYFDGTITTGVKLPNGGIIKVLHLPATITNLEILNQTKIEEFVVPSYANIATLRLENVSNTIDSLAMVRTIAAGSRVRLVGFDWTLDSAESVLALYDALDGMRGLDQNGNNVDKAQLSGTIHVDALTGAQLAEMQERYPNVTIQYNHVNSYLHFYDETGENLLHTVAVADGGDGTYGGSMPTKASTAQYTYTFAGWSLTPGGAVDANALKAVTTDRSVYAVFTATVRTYTVTWKNGSTTLETDTNVPYGTTPTYNGSTPVYNGSGDASEYTFNGWSPVVGPISGDTTYTAQYRYSGYYYAKLIDRSISGAYTNETVTSIGGFAFRSCHALTAASLPAVTSIGESAFDGCSELTAADFPAATSIGISAFNGCSKLTAANFPVATSIGNSAFYNCYELATVDFPSVASIGGSVFRSCSALTTVDFPAATSIGGSAFSGCSNLATVDFPAVTKVDNYAFNGCSKLTTVGFPAATSIGDSAFNYCSALTTVDLPVATSIGRNAFYSCSALTAVILRSATRATLASPNAFASTPIASGAGYIYVPAALVDSYKAAASWSTYANQFRAIEDYPDITGGAA